MSTKLQDSGASPGFWHDFRRFFFRGLAAVLPPLLTIMILVYVFNFVQNKLGKPINTAAKWVVVQVLGIRWGLPFEPEGTEKAWLKVEEIWKDYSLSWIGIVLALIVIYIIGRFLASYVGRAIWRTLERALLRAPLIRTIYPSVKTVTDFLLSKPAISVSRVVAVEYPRKGVWSVGLVTNTGMKTLAEAAGTELLTIFVPSSPTPITGYTITVRREEVIDLSMTVDEALRFTVSGGVLIPPPLQMEGTPLPSVQPAAHGGGEATIKQEEADGE